MIFEANPVGMDSSIVAVGENGSFVCKRQTCARSASSLQSFVDAMHLAYRSRQWTPPRSFYLPPSFSSSPLISTTTTDSCCESFFASQPHGSTVPCEATTFVPCTVRQLGVNTRNDKFAHCVVVALAVVLVRRVNVLLDLQIRNLSVF